MRRKTDFGRPAARSLVGLSIVGCRDTNYCLRSSHFSTVNRLTSIFVKILNYNNKKIYDNIITIKINAHTNQTFQGGGEGEPLNPPLCTPLHTLIHNSIYKIPI